jgi:hypothetical protein
MQPRRTAIENEGGIALFAALLMLLLLLTLCSASLVQSTIDLRATAHYKTGVQAFMAAESGALHGLGTINQRMVRNFKTDIVDHWNAAGTLLGSGQHTLLGDPQSGYSVTVSEDPSNLQNSGFIDGSGWAPLEAARVVRLQVRRANFVGTQGAIYIVDDDFNDFTVNGNQIVVDGNDHLINGALDPGGVNVPAITTRNDTVNNAVTGSIPNNRADQFTGVGYDDSDPQHIKPSVLPLGGPSKDDINDVVGDILRNTPTCPEGAPAPTCVYETSDSTINGGALPLGTEQNPVIIHLTATESIHINGNWVGYGIIIAEGPVRINGTADFFGLVVARNGFDTNMRGNASIRGSVWTYAQTLSVGGSLVVENSQQALQFADSAGLGANMGGNLPRPVVVVGWDER